MTELASVLSAVLGIFQIEFTVSGFTFSFWQIFLFLIVAGAVVFLVCKWVD